MTHNMRIHVGGRTVVIEKDTIEEMQKVEEAVAKGIAGDFHVIALDERGARQGLAARHITGYEVWES